MDLRHLRYFLAVAEERLNIVQPALSMQIKALEAELGGALFIRTSRHVELTEAGILLRAEAQRTLDQVEHTRLAVERSLRGETGRVRVGFAGNAIFSGKMTGDLRRFHKAYPDAEIVIQEVAPQKQVDAILAGQIDIGYTPDNSTTSATAIRAQKVGSWEIRVALTDDHPLAAHACITLEMLAEQPLILYDAHDTHEHVYLMLENELGDKFRVAHRSGSTLSVLAIAAAGLGLALIPAPVQQVNIPGLLYRRLDAPEIMANLVIISRVAEPGNAVRAYLEMAVPVV